MRPQLYRSEEPASRPNLRRFDPQAGSIRRFQNLHRVRDERLRYWSYQGQIWCPKRPILSRISALRGAASTCMRISSATMPATIPGVKTMAYP